MRGAERSFIAKTGAIAFAIALLPHWALGAPPTASVIAAETFDFGPVAAMAVSELRADPSAVIALPELRVPALPRARVASVVEVVAAPAPPPPEPLVTDGVVLASWYGPGFYGNRTACGQTYTPEILGVAHRTLRCGTLISITSPKGITLTVAVIDRGPYIAGRSLDLSNATRAALHCTDLCRVHMRVLD